MTILPLLRALPFHFDETKTRGIKGTSRLCDPWTLLIRNYSGPNYIINTIYVILFFIPHIVQVIVYSTIGSAQAVAISSLSDLVERADQAMNQAIQPADLGQAAPIPDRVRRSLTDLRARINDRRLQEWPLWMVLLGLNQAWFVPVVILSILVLNVARLQLTTAVASLREQEQRSGVSPAWDDYKLYFRAHQMIRILSLISLGSLVPYLATIRALIVTPLVLPS